MSKVANVILITTIEDGAHREGEHPNVFHLNDFLLAQGYPTGMSKVDCHGGGDAVMGSDVWMGAFKDLNVEGFKDIFEAIDWEDPQTLQLLIKDEAELQYQVFTLAKT